MQVFFEAVSVVITAVEGFSAGLLKLVWDLLPAIIELRKITNLITPTNIVASYLGIPAIVITVGVFLITNVKPTQKEHS